MLCVVWWLYSTDLLLRGGVRSYYFKFRLYIRVNVERVLSSNGRSTTSLRLGDGVRLDSLLSVLSALLHVKQSCEASRSGCRQGTKTKVSS